MQLHRQFFATCSDGDIIAAKKLLNENPQINISVRDEEAFRSACHWGHLNVAEWLRTLKPYLYVINYTADGKYVGYYVRAKKEVRWEQIKYLVWLSSSHSPNANCMLYKLPNDISRYIIQNFI